MMKFRNGDGSQSLPLVGRNFPILRQMSLWLKNGQLFQNPICLAVSREHQIFRYISRGNMKKTSELYSSLIMFVTNPLQNLKPSLQSARKFQTSNSISWLRLLV